MNQHWDASGRRTLLSDNTGGGIAMLRPIVFLCIGICFSTGLLFISPFSYGATAQRGPCLHHSLGFKITHIDASQSVGLMWKGDQLISETSTWQNTSLTSERHQWPSSSPTEFEPAILKTSAHWDRNTYTLLNNSDLRKAWRGPDFPKYKRSLCSDVSLFNTAKAATHSAGQATSCFEGANNMAKEISEFVKHYLMYRFIHRSVDNWIRK